MHDVCGDRHAAVLGWEISVFHLGVPQTLVGIGADAAPAGQRPGPILSPWEDCSVGDSSLIGDGSLL